MTLEYGNQLHVLDDYGVCNSREIISFWGGVLAREDVQQLLASLSSPWNTK